MVLVSIFANVLLLTLARFMAINHDYDAVMLANVCVNKANFKQNVAMNILELVVVNRIKSLVMLP